ncbi:MAG: MTH1187 family thiamine-binding protein [Acidobacteriota bacterium]|nr:MAG: MTH1187 family thiamine-binding protein [Acidobacteriota bacterium]
MHATAEIQVIPIGAGVSVRREVKRAHEILRASGLGIELHAFGTNVEGELDDVLAAIKTLHETLHAEGVVRLSTAVKIGTRTDKQPTLAGKVKAVS